MVLLDFWVNAIVSFQFPTIHNWHLRAHIFPSSHELVVIGRDISLGSVLPFSRGPDNKLAAHSLPSLLGCTLRCRVFRAMGKGSFYCICSEVLLYIFSVSNILRRKIHGHNWLLSNHPSLHPPCFFWGRKDASNNMMLASRVFSNQDVFVSSSAGNSRTHTSWGCCEE